MTWLVLTVYVLFAEGYAICAGKGRNKDIGWLIILAPVLTPLVIGAELAAFFHKYNDEKPQWAEGRGR